MELIDLKELFGSHKTTEDANYLRRFVLMDRTSRQVMKANIEDFSS